MTSLLEQALGQDWKHLHPAIKQHYDIEPDSTDAHSMHGIMDRVYHSAYAKLLLPFGILFGSIIPYRGTNVPIRVDNYSAPGKRALFWRREFQFHAFPVTLPSRMELVRGNTLIEYTRFGLGLKLRVEQRDGGVEFFACGFVLRVFGYNLPIPASWFIGKGFIEEKPISDSEFRMKMEFVHPWFGLTYAYSGVFHCE